MELSRWFYLLCICTLQNVQAQKFTDYVDPMIGSGGHGHVFVGASVPYGAVQVGPSNFFKGWDWCSGYNYRDSVIIGFPQLHLSGTGIGDLGDVLIMPYMGDVKLQKGEETERYSGYASQFSHENEIVRPGYYKVKLDDYNIDVELTASERVAFHKYTFPQGEDARIIIDLKEGINDKPVDTYIELTDKYTIKGYRSSEGWAKKQQVFFAIKSSVPITDFSIYEDAELLEGKKRKGKSLKGLITFKKSPETIQLKVGISSVSANNALANIKSEIPDWDFAKVVEQADGKWNKELARIQIETSNDVDKRIFYTSMFHLMIHPSLFNDSNGEYRGADWKAYKNPGFDNHTIFSLWDTYRAAHPLFTIIDRQRTADFVNSMLAVFDQTGMLPIWHLRGYDTGTMVGINSFQIIAEAYMKGIEGFDAERAFHALKVSAMHDVRGLDFDREMKPIPSDVMKNRPVATALEYAIGTASIALMAKKMGKMDDYTYFQQRSMNYKLYFDKVTGFFRGKMADGSWNPVFDPIKSVRPWATDYAEGNPWQYLWLVPQDVEGLIELLGGEVAFTDRLNTFFTLSSAGDPDVLVDLTGCIGQYAHGNEPSHHISYLFAYVGQQWQTARLTRKIIKDFYHDRPDGIIGNEDCGQMSAWYIFSSLGFYPVFTASGQYVLGSPLFDKAIINLGNGKRFIIETINNTSENIYIQSAELNGKKHDSSFISHDDIMQGGTLRIYMGDKPNYNFGQNPASRLQYVNSWEKKDGELVIETVEGILHLRPYDFGALHYKLIPPEQNDKESYAVINEFPAIDFKIEEDDSDLALITGKYRFVLHKSTGNFSFYNSENKLLLKDAVNKREAIKAGSIVPHNLFKITSEEALYGLGQFRDNALNLRGKKRELIQFNTQAAVPVIYSTAGWGLFWDNPSRTVFEDSKNGMSFTSDFGNKLDFYLFAGSTIDSLIASYRRLTGEVPMIPYWSLGYHQSRNKYATQEEILNIAQRMDKEKIQMSSIFIDYFYWQKYGTGSHRFDEALFPNPQSMLKTLQEKYQTKAVITIWPAFKKGTEHYEEFESKGMLLDGAKALDGIIYDVFNPEARNLYWKQILPLVKTGLGGWFLDGPEPDQIASFLPANTFAGPAVTVRNLYPLLHAENFYNNLITLYPNERPYLLTRCAWAAQQRTGAAIWSGDIPTTFDELRKQITAGLNFVSTGIPYWTTDIGGYQGGDPESEEYRELFTRWFEYGTFCPIFRCHGRRYPGDTKAPNELWAYGEEVQEICTGYINLRYLLMPYIYTLTADVTHKNYTPMRLLAFDFPEDENVRDCKDQFMYGPAFLVCPVLEAGSTSREVYLPAGGWFDFHSRRFYKGGQTITADAPLSKMPLYVKAGSIIPQYADSSKTNKIGNSLKIYIYRGADGAFDLYEDDGSSFDYKKGKFHYIPFVWNDAKKELEIGAVQGNELIPANGKQLEIIPVGPTLEKIHPVSVVYKGEPLHIQI
jgi:predicted alpha-1,2-mannosidase